MNKNVKNWLVGIAVHLALVTLVWAFPVITADFKKPERFLWWMLFITPLAAGAVGWLINMLQSNFKKETPNGADAARTVYGSLLPIVPVAIIGFGWYLPIGFLAAAAAAFIIHYKK